MILNRKSVNHSNQDDRGSLRSAHNPIQLHQAREAHGGSSAKFRQAGSEPNRFHMPERQSSTLWPASSSPRGKARLIALTDRSCGQRPNSALATNSKEKRRADSFERKAQNFPHRRRRTAPPAPPALMTEFYALMPALVIAAVVVLISRQS